MELKEGRFLNQDLGAEKAPNFKQCHCLHHQDLGARTTAANVGIEEACTPPFRDSMKERKRQRVNERNSTF